MKQYLTRPVVLIGLLIVSVVIAWAASGQASIPLNANLDNSKVSKAYVKNQTDTVIINREGSMSALALGIHTKDSSKITLAVVRRVVDGVASALAAGDTLAPFTAWRNTTNAGATATAEITLAPLADQYWVIVTYENSDTTQGVSTPTVVYEALKQYSRR